MRTSIILAAAVATLLSLSSPAMAGEGDILLAGIGSQDGAAHSGETSVLQAGIADGRQSQRTGSDRTTAHAFQAGHANATLIEQSGGTNGTAIAQLGKGNLAIATQTGAYNDASLTQTGNDLVIVSQRGVGLTLAADQIPDYPALVIQQGVGSRSVTKVIPLSKR
jgi:hypothetical protein